MFFQSMAFIMASRSLSQPSPVFALVKWSGLTKPRSSMNFFVLVALITKPPRSIRPAARSLANGFRAAFCKSRSHWPRPSNGFSICGLKPARTRPCLP
jgi:hypothetical protein